MWPGLAGGYDDEGTGATAIVKLPGGRLAVAGRFDYADGLPIRSPAVWDGRAWAPLGSKLPAPPRDLAVTSDGVVWAAGPSYVARLDGVVWQLLVEGDGRYGIEVIDDALYVHGRFSSIGGIEAHGLARWDGAWSSLGLPAGSGVASVVRDGDDLCVGGGITLAPTMYVGAACRRDGEWTPLGTDPTFSVSTLARGADGRWFAGGWISFYTQDGDTLGLGIARLGEDGVWAPLDGGLYGPDGFFPEPIVTRILADGDGVIVSGNFVLAGSARMHAGGIARWSAREGWRPIANKLGHDDVVWDVLLDGERLHVAGTFGGLGTAIAPFVATVEPTGDVTRWSAVDPLVVAGAAAVIGTRDRVFVVGQLATDGVRDASVLAIGADGVHVPAQPRGGRYGEKRAVALADGSLVLDSGDLLERWDGARWSTLSEDRVAPLAATDDGGFVGVRGDGYGPGGRVVRWRDGEWSTLGTFTEPLVALAVHDGAVFAAFTSHEYGGTSLRELRDETWSERWRDRQLGVHTMVSSPSLGVVLATTGGALAYDGETWRMLDHARTSALAACESGVITAGYEGERAAIVLHTPGGTTPIVDVDGMVTALAARPDGVFVSSADPRRPNLRRWTTAPARAR